MAGIYIHVPFCRSRCVYCGFFSTTQLDRCNDYADAVARELSMRRDYLGDEAVETVYFGGGTPSQLSLEQIETIMSYIYKYNVRASELTIECNPDDIAGNHTFLEGLLHMGFNRISMGVQTFSDQRLAFLHRRHSASQAMQAVEDARRAGFHNISIDLMFGFPGQSLEEWKADVDRAISLGVQHVSAYSLMYEEGTALERMLSRGEVEEISDELSLAMYDYLCEALEQAGYEHYEISNFAQKGYRSRHNSSYWQGIKYLGAGAGAHSYNGVTRQYNCESVSDYIDAVCKGTLPFEVEQLSMSEHYDEFVFTALRTSDGLDVNTLQRKFGAKFKDYFVQNLSRHIENGVVEHKNGIVRLTKKGLFVSNDVMSDLMWCE